MRLWMTPLQYATIPRPINARRWLARAGLVALSTTWGCRVLVDFERRPASDPSADAAAADAAALPDSNGTAPPEANGAAEGASGACVLGRAVLGVCRLSASRK
jgi:hypothetical protein